MTFGEVLKELLELADIKQIQLAEHLGYDVSYINKWISGQKQPSVRNNRALFQNIAEFLIKYGDPHFKSVFQDRENELDKVSDAEYIQYIIEKLSAAYCPPKVKRAKNSVPMEHNCFFGKLSTAYTVSNRQNIAAIRSAVKNKGIHVLEFISIPPLDFCGFGEAKSDWMEKLTALPQGIKMHVRFAADFRQKEFHTMLYKDIFIFLFGLPESVTFDIYQDDIFYSLRQGVYVCQNALSMQFFKSVLWQENSEVITYDPQLVNDCYSTADHLLSKSLPLLHRETLHTLYARKYFQSFLLNQKLSAFHTVMPLLYVSDAQFGVFCEQYHISDSLRDMYRFYERTADRWTFVIYKSALLQFLFEGSLWIMGKTVVLKKEERAEYLSNLIEAISKGMIDICILSDVNPVLNLTDVKCSLFMNEKNMFAVRQEEADASHPILYADDENILGCFSAFFEDIRKLPPQFCMTGQAVVDVLHQYLELIRPE